MFSCNAQALAQLAHAPVQIDAYRFWSESGQPRDLGAAQAFDQAQGKRLRVGGRQSLDRREHARCLCVQGGVRMCVRHLVAVIHRLFTRAIRAALVSRNARDPCAEMRRLAKLAQPLKGEGETFLRQLIGNRWPKASQKQAVHQGQEAPVQFCARGLMSRSGACHGFDERLDCAALCWLANRRTSRDKRYQRANLRTRRLTMAGRACSFSGTPLEMSMRAILYIVLATLGMALGPVSSANAEPLLPWDALPAFEPMHLSGAYAGRQVCPMCTHGYDAGLVLFLPKTTALADAEAIAQSLRGLRDAMPSQRYRIFIILAGTQTPEPLHAALKSTHSQWFVAELSGKALGAAERDFGIPLAQAPVAFAFSQRRLIGQYASPDLLHAERKLIADARFAMQLLDWLYPSATTLGADHDTPQGALWLAPSRFRETLRLHQTSASAACFLDDAGHAVSRALLRLSPLDGGSGRPYWERSDVRGCVQLAAAPGRYGVTLYSIGNPPVEREILRLEPDVHVPVIGGCEGCEAAFADRPLHLSSHARLAPEAEAGERMRIEGRVFAADGAPAPGVQIYAYQTDVHGIYPLIENRSPAARLHGRLRAWAVSDTDGQYRFESVRPGGYPGSDLVAHVHLQVIEDNRCTYFLDDLEFSDDPRRVGSPQRARPRGGSGLTTPRRDSDGRWLVRRDIQLGRNIPDYARCSG